MDEMAIKPEDLELVANLIGSTNGQLKAIDSKAIDGKNSPTFKAAKFDAKAAIKEAITRTGQPIPDRSLNPSPIREVPSYQQAAPEYRQAQPVSTTQMVILDPTVAQKITDELKRLQDLVLTLSEQVLHLTTVDDKVSQVIEKSLKQGVKSFTIKLNDDSIKE